ncbi:MAG TPA: nucleoside triphosphate pyrophosphohydrolase [Rhodospirillaceae bacterium]|nr:MAG: nucleoside triphosphate pyrophosphohydrolase [Alphaproteobacteria bacterium GWF2_58_20]HAU28730.1 nucleoside triphosphate pyrophosphohydrolase [Rhodospirillaceae bacterium]
MTNNGINRLLGIMARLRDPEKGCNWDRQQTFATIAPYTVEEAYEVSDAIARNDMNSLKDECGDLLFQVVFYAQMAKEAGLFDMDDIANAISNKLERRHPHIFLDDNASIPAEQTKRLWEDQKVQERKEKGHESVLDDVPHALPPMMRAKKLQARAARIGFDWPSALPIFDKVQEELAELRAEVEKGAPHARLEDELGDVLFVLSNLSRHLQVDTDSALRSTSAKFERRFRFVEKKALEAGKSLETMPMTEMDALWDEAKKQGF